MSKKNDVEYEDARSYLINKDKNVTYFITDMLAKTSQMFEYDNLPDSLPKRELERMLQTNGDVFITKVNDDLYAFTGGVGGELDAYYRPTIYTVANPALNISREYRIGIDGIRMLNDSESMGIMPILNKYAALICDAEISLDVATVLARITMLISAPDDKSKASAESFVTKIINGDFSVIGDSQLFDGVKAQTLMDSAQRLQQLIEVLQYLKASVYNELGIGAATNLKRERINVAEVAQSNSVLIPFVYDMLKCRERYISDVNEMFDTDISVSLSSVWVNYDNIDDANTPTVTPPTPADPDESEPSDPAKDGDPDED